MGPTITFIAGIALLVATLVFVNTPEGRRWIEDQVRTALGIASDVVPPSATAAPHYPDQRQRRSTP
jgi:hypothetical protein